MPLGLEELILADFLDNLHMKVARMLSLRTVRLYLSIDAFWYSFIMQGELNTGS